MKSQYGVSSKQKKVFVGMSGGVDSSVSAALLQKADYNVTGVFIKIWSPEWIGCTSKADRLDAMRVCARLSIPFREIDLTKEYKKEVVDYMISEYKTGRTPNPDVFCNRYIKFGAFFDWALKQGADFVATGHYASRFLFTKIEDPRFCKAKSGQIIRYTLQASRDSEKDQTYFLWTLTQRELSQTLFPIGQLTKLEVRKLAKKFGLPTAEKKDSQGLCFVGPVNVKEFLRQYIKPKRGNVLNTEGEIIGWHDGAEFLTIGERHGFTITKKTPQDLPYYVVAKDIKKNTITVSHTLNHKMSSSGKLFADQPLPHLAKSLPPTTFCGVLDKVVLRNVNWIAGQAPDFSKTYFARFRYRQPLQEIKIVKARSSRTATILWQSDCYDRYRAIASGQSLVVYTKAGECLGGGVIS